jgi:hypothetical protein
MDLGALELQIFVSLVVVLGSAFVALICDYLKGNNEQLRERNIELRVRTEEQERFAILNPAGWLSQFRSAPAAQSAAAAPAAAPVMADQVMHSHAPAEGLAYVAEREAYLAHRSAEAAPADETLGEVPAVAGFDVASRRRSRRKRGMTEEFATNGPAENSYDWVRPEVMARVARRAGRPADDAADYIPTDHEAPRPAVESMPEIAAPEPAVPALLEAPVSALEAAAPVAPPILELPAPAPAPVLELQTEIERISRTESRPAAAHPPVIMLRPLPALKLNEELQRIAESTQQTEAMAYSSQLLDDVIAASASKPMPVPEPVAALDPVEVPEPVVAEPAETLAPVEIEAVAPEALPEPIAEALPEPIAEALPEPIAEALPEPIVEALPEPIAEPVAELPFPVFEASPEVELPPSFAAFAKSELTEPVAFPTYDALPPVAETPAYDWSGVEFAPLPETVFVSEAFAAERVIEYPPIASSPFAMPPVNPEVPPPPFVAPMLSLVPVEPEAVIEEEPAPLPEPVLSDLLLPAGLQDKATYMRLLDLPNPMTGIVITISVNDYHRLATTVSAQELPGLLGSVETLMTSMIREGDFGVQLAEDQWLFVYRIDDQGLSQRRVAGLSERLWDFQLRHLGLSNLSFSWAAVNVNSERFSDAVAAAVERMEASRRGNKKAAERSRLVVNG